MRSEGEAAVGVRDSCQGCVITIIYRQVMDNGKLVIQILILLKIYNDEK